MRTSRAGRTGRSWYGAYAVWYCDAQGEHKYDVTNRASGERFARSHVQKGAAWAELRGDSTNERTRGVVHARFEAAPAAGVRREGPRPRPRTSSGGRRSC